MDIIFKEKMNDTQINEFERRIYYLSEDIENFEKIYRDESVIGEHFTLKEGADTTKIYDRALEIIQNEIIGLKNINVDRIWDNNAARAIDSDNILEMLIKEGLVIIPAKGQVSLKEPLVGLFDCFDHIFKVISVELFGCENYRFPTLLKMDILKKVGYFESFPNLLMFTTRLKNTVDNYSSFKETFVEENSSTDFVDSLDEFCCGTNFGLPPTMCYYVYDMLSGTEIKQKAVTANGKSFRYENKYEKPFERLWDFTIRETVFLGDYNYVKDNVNKYKKIAIKLMNELDLLGFCEVANDPFFLVENTTKRINAQKMFGSKYELRLKLRDDKTAAIGSFNLHGNFLAKRFGLYTNKDKQTYCFTGCIGIGLERLLFAFLTQYGCDISNWPLLVREGMENPQSINERIKKLALD